MTETVGPVDVEIYQVDEDVEEVIACGCHRWAFERYADFYAHTNGTFPTIAEAEDEAIVFSTVSQYRHWAREHELEAKVIAEVREPEGGGYSIDIPASVGASTMRTSYAKGYEAFVDGVLRDENPYDPKAPEYDGWSGFVRARQKRWWSGWDDAEERLGGKSWVESRRDRLDEDDDG
jgi:hypothetical protein